jgi:hypothetical protein
VNALTTDTELSGDGALGVGLHHLRDGFSGLRPTEQSQSLVLSEVVRPAQPRHDQWMVVPEMVVPVTLK